MLRGMFKICLSLLLLCLPLQSIYPNPCQWELGAELFFFTTEDFPFAEAVTMTTGTNFSSGRGNDVLFDPSYKPGFRLEAAAIFDCLHAFDMRFTYFDAIISNQATGHFSMLNNPLEHQATATLKQRFYEIEFLFGRWLFFFQLVHNILILDSKQHQACQLLQPEALASRPLERIPFRQKFGELGPKSFSISPFRSLVVSS